MKQVIELCIASGITLCYLATPSPSFAQIVPDATLPVNSNVTSDGNTNIINGGTQAGGNLFHSFEQFSVPTGSAAYFNNALNIQNIISRVTGSSISNIDGLIRANGTANLFLLNPNGIIFGRDASLSIGGSFLASTASAVNFADGTQFIATPHPTTPLLTVNVPIGLQFGGTAGSIQNHSQATNSSANPGGLQVQPGKTLALVGGDVSLDGGTLQAPGGRVELGGVASSGTVGLFVDGNSLLLSFPDNLVRSSVSLANRSSVNVLAGGGGSIAINAQNLSMVGGSRLQAGIDSDLGSMNSVAGDVEINSTGTINLTNQSTITNELLPRAKGSGGDIRITTGALALTNGAQLSTRTSGQGDAGSVTIFARDTVSFDGESRGGRSGAFSGVAEGVVGNGGDINITTGSLALTDGALLDSSTKGQGNAGSVTIFARDNISFNGETNNGSPSEVLSTVEAGAMGNGGDINITTGSFTLTNGGRLIASLRQGRRGNAGGVGNAGSVTIFARDNISFEGISSNKTRGGALSNVEFEAVGSSGDINITTGSFTLTNGALLDSSTKGPGNAGNVTIFARDTISFDGETSIARSSGIFSSVDRVAGGNGGSINITTGSLALTNGARLSGGTFGQGNAGSVTIFARDNISLDGRSSDGTSRSGVISRVGPAAMGNAGGINITTDGQLIVRDGAQVNVSSQGLGNSGDLFIKAGDLLLDRGQLLASTASGEGGNINLQLQNLILMRRNSLISAEARGSGNGGSITIKSPLLVSVPSENSDIIAKAIEGRGGNINITTQGIYGLTYRDQLTQESDINASSQFGVNGVVQINTLDIDPSLGLVVLPVELVDASGLIASSCEAGGRRQEQSEFIVTGRGGLPPNPSESLSSDTVWTDLRPSAKLAENVPISEEAIQLNNPTTGQLVEAQGWEINSKGEVVLTATAPTVTPHIPWMTPPTCHTLETSS